MHQQQQCISSNIASAATLHQQHQHFSSITFGASPPLVHHHLWCITTFDASPPLVHHPLWCITPFGASPPLVHHHLWCITYVGLSAYPLLTISNLTTGIIIFDILSPRAFRKYTTPMVFREFLKNPTYPKIWGLSAYPDTTRHHQTCSRHHQTRTRQYLIGWQWSFVDL